MPFPLLAAAGGLGAGALAKGALSKLMSKGLPQLAGKLAKKIGGPLAKLSGPVAAGAGIGVGTAAVSSAIGSAVGGDYEAVPYRRKGKGITATEMRGYWKVCRVLSSMGMRPKTGCAPKRRSRRCR